MSFDIRGVSNASDTYVYVYIYIRIYTHTVKDWSLDLRTCVLLRKGQAQQSNQPIELPTPPSDAPPVLHGTLAIVATSAA